MVGGVTLSAGTIDTGTAVPHSVVEGTPFRRTAESRTEFVEPGEPDCVSPAT